MSWLSSPPPSPSLESVASSPLSPVYEHHYNMESSYTRPALHLQSQFPSADQTSLRKHNHYYFADGNVIFLVENTLYNIHRYFFQRDSSSFASMLSTPSGGYRQGSTNDKPIPLTGVTVIDFDQFLSILYPIDFGVFTATTVEEWISILSIAAKFNFKSIKALAIKYLAPIASPIDKVVYGRKFEIDDWLLPAYNAICGRQDALTLEEGRRLGVDDVIKIAALRQGNGCPDFSATEQVDSVKQVFGLADVPVNGQLRADDGMQIGETLEMRHSDDPSEIEAESVREEILGEGMQEPLCREDGDGGQDICYYRASDDSLCGRYSCVCAIGKKDDAHATDIPTWRVTLPFLCPFCDRCDCVCRTKKKDEDDDDKTSTLDDKRVRGKGSDVPVEQAQWVPNQPEGTFGEGGEQQYRDEVGALGTGLSGAGQVAYDGDPNWTPSLWRLRGINAEIIDQNVGNTEKVIRDSQKITPAIKPFTAPILRNDNGDKDRKDRDSNDSPENSHTYGDCDCVVCRRTAAAVRSQPEGDKKRKGRKKK